MKIVVNLSVIDFMYEFFQFRNKKYLSNKQIQAVQPSRFRRDYPDF